VRILLDTNVLISAFLSRGLCSELIEHCSEQHALVTSPQIIQELREKFLTKFRMPPAAVDQALAALFHGMEIVAPVDLPERVCRDPDDDVIIASAISGACDLVISGDRDLLDLKGYAGIAFLSPREFMDADANQAG
jgi:putative PIN family toxin of toxin-antitoxin system